MEFDNKEILIENPINVKLVESVDLTSFLVTYKDDTQVWIKNVDIVKDTKNKLSKKANEYANSIPSVNTKEVRILSDITDGDYCIVEDEDGTKTIISINNETINEFKTMLPSIDFSMKLTAPDGAENDLFGFPIVMNDEYIVISAFRPDKDKSNVYIFKTDGTYVTKLASPDNTSENILFGLPVVLNNDYIVVGAVACNNKTGCAYIFKLT